MANLLIGCLLDFRKLNNFFWCALISDQQSKVVGGMGGRWLLGWEAADTYIKTLLRVPVCPTSINCRPRQVSKDLEMFIQTLKSIPGPYLLFGAIHRVYCLSSDFT